MRVRRSGLLGYVLVVFLVLLGVLAFAVMLLGGLGRAAEGLERLEFHGLVRLDVAEPGTYLVFLEQSNSDPLQWQVVEEASQASLTLQEPRLESSYSLPGQKGELLFEFRAERTGNYIISAETQGETFTLAWGKDYYRQAILALLAALVVLIASLVVAGILLFRHVRQTLEGLA